MIKKNEKYEKINKYANENPCMCFNIRKSARVITQLYDEMFKSVGLRSTQIAILTSLESIGAVTISELAEAMVTDRTTLTRNLKPLERDGLIEFHEGEDKRSKAVHLTEKGNMIAKNSAEIWKVFQSKMQSEIGEGRLTQLYKDLSKAVSDIQKL